VVSSNQMRLCFAASDLGINSEVEAAIDDIRIITLICDYYLCGDANNDAAVDVSDAVYIINYVFVGGTPPDPYYLGDANCDLAVDVSDAVWIINFVFVGGNQPCDLDGDGQSDCPRH